MVCVQGLFVGKLPSAGAGPGTFEAASGVPCSASGKTQRPFIETPGAGFYSKGQH